MSVEEHKPYYSGISSYKATPLSLTESDQSDLEQTLDTILSRLDETDVRLLLRVWSARTHEQESPGIEKTAEMMKDMMKSEYITTGDLGMLEKDMMAAGISFPVIVRDIPGVPDKLKYTRTTEVTVGPMGGEVEIPVFFKLNAPPGVLQQDTVITVSTVDIPRILRGPEGANWISGYPWSLGEDTCPRELLDQVLFSPAVDINLHGAQLNGPVELHTWRPPGSEGMKCLLLKHHDGEGWTDITASTVHHIYPDKISMSLQTFSRLTILWVPLALISVHVVNMIISVLASRTSNCWFAGYIKPHEEGVEFHVVCRDRSVQTNKYKPGFTQCESNKAMFDLYHGDFVQVTVSLRRGEEKSRQIELCAQQCHEDDGQCVQMILDRPNGKSVAGDVTISYVQRRPPRTVCEFSFWVEGDTLTRDGNKTKPYPPETWQPETAPHGTTPDFTSANGDSNKTKPHTDTSQPEALHSVITPGSRANASGRSAKPVVLLINDEYVNSTINRQMAGFLVSEGAVVYSLVLSATKDDEDDAATDGVRLILPTIFKGDLRKPIPGWLTWDHLIRYPELPSNVGFVVGHVNITSRAARRIKEQRLPDAKLVQITHVIPEDTSQYKSDAKVLSIGDETASILEDLQHADVIFSVGPYVYDYYKSQTRGVMKPHHEFLPKPSDIFSKVQVKHVDTETKVVLSIGRVKGVERVKGYDLAAKTMSIVIEQLPNTKWRARGVSAEDFPESKAIIQANVEKGKFNFTPLKYASQKELSEDMQKADVVLMPSRAEPFGLVGLEAIAAGIPVLVSHKSGLAWFLKSQDPEFDRLIVEIADDDDEAAKTLAKRVIAVLKNGRREFEASRRLKEKLLASKYWERSHREFIAAFGLLSLPFEFEDLLDEDYLPRP